MTHDDSRRAPRFKVTLKVQITGIDEQPVLRTGDISAGGLFLTLDREVGPIGSMQRMLLRSDDDACEAVLLARVVRVAAVDDLWRGRSIAGVAFQFLFAEERAADFPGTTTRPAGESELVERLLRALIERAAARSGVKLGNVRGTLHAPGGTQSAELEDLSVRGMVLDTDRELATNASVRLELPGRDPGSRLAFEGEVLDCQPIQPSELVPARYRTIVRFGAITPPTRAQAKAAAASMDEAFEALMLAFTSIRPGPATHERELHLAGELSRISLLSVLTLCQLERVNGVLLLAHERRRARAYLRDGELVDALMEGSDASPRAALSTVLDWPGGSFEVAFEKVERPNRIGESTTVLLIDLARELDESRQH